MNDFAKLDELIAQVGPLNESAQAAAAARQDTLTKPPGSLGLLEAISIRMAGITGDSIPQIKEKVVIVMAGDHGVVAEGVSAYPSEVTPQMVMNMLAGGAAINVLSRHAGVRTVVVDMGVASPLGALDGLVDKKVALGTENMAIGPAMSREQAARGLLAGAEVFTAELAHGLDILATGDMGIGNTTPSAAIAALLTGASAEDIVGRGTGVDDAGLARKIEVVEKALAVNAANPDDGLDVLAKLGGYEIAGLAGAILAAAAARRPVVVDGFISTAAAMVAATLCPAVRDYLFAAHCSQETGHRLMMAWLGLKPMLEFNMRLGEGTGAVLAISIIQASCKILAEMATFAEAGVSDKEPETA
jgi:nicotinate-nucleotide--dimethylbenzimidazole phosphoribosyltransferase